MAAGSCRRRRQGPRFESLSSLILGLTFYIQFITKCLGSILVLEFYVPLFGPNCISLLRCDACRASALLLDSVLRKADAKIEAAGGELEKEEVEQIINHVCHISSYHNVELVEWEGKARLAHPHLETWEKRGVPHLQGQVHAPPPLLLCDPQCAQGMHWAGRVSDHCHYLIGHQRMDAAELYDLWLRAGYRATEEWVKFLCEVDLAIIITAPTFFLPG